MAESEDVLRQNVTALLRNKNVPNAALARHLGKTSAWVSQFLSGRNSVPVKSLTPIADFLGVTVDALLRPSAPPQKHNPSAASPKGRQVFSSEAGEAFKRLRLDAPRNTPLPPQKRIRSTSKPRTKLGNPFAAAREAKRLGIKGLSQNMLFRAESGKIKRPSADFLRALAKLYGYEYESFAAEISAVYLGMTRSDTPTSDDRKIGAETRTNVLSSPSNPTLSAHGSPNPSANTEERIRALEGGLQTVLGIAFGLLGKEAAIGIIDVAADSRRNDGALKDSPWTGEGDRAVRPRRAGAGR